MATSTSRPSRPTPHTLPKLRIPQRCSPTPEEITISRADDFLRFCAKHKRAPVTILPLPIPKEEEEEEKERKKKKAEEGAADSGIRDRNHVTTPATLQFTTREWEELDAKKAAYEEVKASHTHWLNEMKRNSTDREAVRQCRHFRELRQSLDMEISALQDRRRIRREFRRDFNKIPGLEAILDVMGTLAKLQEQEHTAQLTSATRLTIA
ncbi:hypothetical protein F4779DRAFT_620892 [Xylariaceae sp. FL0662B]|nr:hypothetical protein F4779DRAFT_620892 [Xylariaceae sp. FL0662B]